jgi:hypothetical protein
MSEMTDYSLLGVVINEVEKRHVQIDERLKSSRKHAMWAAVVSAVSFVVSVGIPIITALKG